ncbi:MAG: hypothetical protein V4623_02150 [Pseudomonadota bacterium]
MEIYSTSWTLDLLKAWAVSKNKLVAQGLISATTKLQLNGLSDPSESLPNTHAKGGHSVGMGIDLGFGPTYVVRDNQNANNGGITPATIPGGTAPYHLYGPWSIDNALEWTASKYLPNVPTNDQQGALRNFLSLYAVTQNDHDPSNSKTDTNGTWEELPVRNGESVLQALFGSGRQNAKQLIQNVWIGSPSANPYTAMNAILSKLGFSSQFGNQVLHHGQQPYHQNHFHIDLRPPERRPITAHLLAAGSPDASSLSEASSSAADAALIASAQAWLEQVKTDIELNLSSGEVTMFAMDMPNVPPQNQPLMIAQANQAQSASTKMRTFGICFPAPNELFSLENVTDPKVASIEYLWRYEHRRIIKTEPATVSILQEPKHGVLRLMTEADRGTLFSDTAGPIDPSDPAYVYLPNPGYLGKDKAIFLVEIGGVKVKVIYFLQAIDGPIGDIQTLCGKRGYSWNISLSPRPAPSNLDFLLSASGLSNSPITYQMAPLPGATLAQTTGQSITLNTYAAGDEWYLDPTPSDNDEYLPTLNTLQSAASPLIHNSPAITSNLATVRLSVEAVNDAPVVQTVQSALLSRP